MHTTRTAMHVWYLLHWRALRAHLRPVLFVALGVCLGTTLFAAMVFMVFSTGQPFGFNDALRANNVDYVVTPRVVRGLDERLVPELDGIDGVDLVIPLVGGLTQAESRDADQGVLLVGTDCRAEELIGDYGCRTYRPDVQRDGHPLLISTTTAQALGVEVGDPIGVPGGFVGDAYVATIVDVAELPEAAKLNNGYWAVGSIPDVQDLLGSGPYLDRLLVRADTAGATGIERVVGDVADVGDNGNPAGFFLAVTRQLILLASFVVLGGGMLIAGNTFALAIEQRRRELAIPALIGLTPRRLAVGLGLEGALIGTAAGFVSVVPAALLGRWFTLQWGAELVAGTGATLDVSVFVWWLPVLCILGGASAGLFATVPTSWKWYRASRTSTVAQARRRGRQRIRIRYGWGLVGALSVLASFVVSKLFGAGYVNNMIGMAGGALLVVGLILVFFTLAPLSGLAVEWIASRGKAAALLTAADLGRDPVRWTVVTVVIAIALLGVGFSTVSDMLVASATRHIAGETQGRVYVTPRGLGEQSGARFSAAAIDRLNELPGIERVLPQKLAVVDTDWGALNIAGTDPVAPRGNLTFSSDVDAAAVWSDVEAGDVIVARELANAQSLALGDTITLPTVEGMRSFRVAGVASAGLTQDNGIGRWIVTSTTIATQFWGATIDSVILEPEDPNATADLAGAIQAESGIVRLDTLDASNAEAAAAEQGRRFLAPIARIGWILVIFAALAIGLFLALGLTQRERPRTVLHWIGYSKRLEKRTLTYDILTVAGIGFVLGTLGSWSFALYIAWASPAVLASQVTWSFQFSGIAASVFALGIIVAIATVVSWHKANELERQLAERAQPSGAKPPLRRFRREPAVSQVSHAGTSPNPAALTSTD